MRIYARGHATLKLSEYENNESMRLFIEMYHLYICAAKKMMITENDRLETYARFCGHIRTLFDTDNYINIGVSKDSCGDKCLSFLFFAIPYEVGTKYKMYVDENRKKG
ncbi:MAG: hypothetical protein RR744_10780, partial [Cellulosilyticaceae bacterium]